MNILKRYTATLIIAIVITSCENNKVAKEDKPLNIICLIDFSKSIPDATTSWFRHVIGNNILMGLRTSDCIAVLPIDRGSATATKEILFVDLFDFASSIKVEADNKMQEVQKKRQLFSDYIQNKLIPEFNSNYNMFRAERINMSNETDIIGGLRIAGKYFRNDMRNIIIVFSDMIQYSPELKMSKNEITDKIQNQFANISIPEIKGGEVLVLTGEQPSITPVQMNNIKLFWQSFLQKQDALVIGYGSGELIDLNKLITSK